MNQKMAVNESLIKASKMFVILVPFFDGNSGKYKCITILL